MSVFVWKNSRAKVHTMDSYCRFDHNLCVLHVWRHIMCEHSTNATKWSSQKNSLHGIVSFILHHTNHFGPKLTKIKMNLKRIFSRNLYNEEEPIFTISILNFSHFRDLFPTKSFFKGNIKKNRITLMDWFQWALNL